MSNPEKKRRTVAEADITIAELNEKIHNLVEEISTLNKAKGSNEEVEALHQEIEILGELLTKRDTKIEVLEAKIIPSLVSDQVSSLEKVCKDFKPGLYVAAGHSMYNGSTLQHFTVGKPIKVSADQLKDSWFLLQLANKTLVPYDG